MHMRRRIRSRLDNWVSTLDNKLRAAEAKEVGSSVALSERLLRKQRKERTEHFHAPSHG